MGRAPCCDKANVKKGPWSPEEDSKLKDYIVKNGTGGNWIALPQKAGLRRCGKSCRLRWLNYLRPNIRHGEFSEEEDRVICSLYATIGSRWSLIAAQLSGRTDNDIKNYWNTKLKKKLMAFAAASSSTTTSSSNETSLQRSTLGSSKPPCLYSSTSQSDNMNSLYSFNYTPNYNSNTTKPKPSINEPSFSCHQMMTSSGNNTVTTSSCSTLETSLSLFQNQQYYQPLLVFGSSTTTDQQTSWRSNDSDNGGNKQQDNMGSFHMFNNNMSNNDNNVAITNGFDESKGFLHSGYDERISNDNDSLSQFDNMYSSTAHAPAAVMMDFYDINEDGNKQLNVNINDLSLINIGDDQNQNHAIIKSKITTPLDQPIMKDHKDRRMMTYYFNSNYDYSSSLLGHDDHYISST